MRVSAFVGLLTAVLLINAPSCTPAKSNDDASRSDAAESANNVELFSLTVKEDGYDITFTETERGENYSLATVELKEGTSVGSSMVIGRCVYEIAKQREFEYFMTADREIEGQIESGMIIYFTNDESVSLKELVGDDYSEELQEEYDDMGLVPVSMFAIMFDAEEVIDALPSGQETDEGLYINTQSDGGEEITVEETERGANFSTIVFGILDEDSAMEHALFLLRCQCEVATLRGFEYFIEVELTAEDEFPWITKMYFTNNADPTLEELLGDEDDDAMRAQLAGKSTESVSEYCAMFESPEN